MVLEPEPEPEEEMVAISFEEDDKQIDIEKLKRSMKTNKFLLNKKIFINHLQGKITKLNICNRYLDHKYNDYLKSYNQLSIAVIVLSSILTLIEAFSGLYKVDEIEIFYLKSSLKCIPLIVSTIVSVIATLVRFLKYQEHLEKLGITGEKSVIAISKIKRIKENVTFCDDEIDFKSIVDIYLSETYETYNEVNIKVSLELSEADYLTYKDKIEGLDEKFKKKCEEDVEHASNKNTTNPTETTNPKP